MRTAVLRVWRGGIGETIRTLFYALLIALAFRSAFFQPFSIPSGSMKPTLLIGDYLFVSKYAYGYSRHSLPLSPAFLPEGRWPDSRGPERGDVIVFKLPKDGTTDYIKRVIGLPGDFVQVKGGVVHINGEPVERELVGDFAEPLGARGTLRCERRGVNEGGERVCLKSVFRETLPNGRSYLTLNANDDRVSGSDNTRPYAVPEGHYFFMGDNRDNSIDSRYLDAVGFVPAANFVGRAEIIFLSSESRAFFPWDWRFDRFLDDLR